jgi:hypothetical protein
MTPQDLFSRAWSRPTATPPTSRPWPIAELLQDVQQEEEQP